MKTDIVIAFVFGIFTRNLQNKLGDWLLDPIYNRITEDIKSYPMISHYLLRHDGRYNHCEPCKFGVRKQFDIS